MCTYVCMLVAFSLATKGRGRAKPGYSQYRVNRENSVADFNSALS